MSARQTTIKRPPAPALPDHDVYFMASAISPGDWHAICHCGWVSKGPNDRVRRAAARHEAIVDPS